MSMPGFTADSSITTSQTRYFAVRTPGEARGPVEAQMLALSNAGLGTGLGYSNSCNAACRCCARNGNRFCCSHCRWCSWP